MPTNTPHALHLDVRCNDLGQPVAIDFTDALGRPVDPPETFTFPVKWFRDHPEWGHLVERQELTQVVRPAMTDPDTAEDGTLVAKDGDERRHVILHAARVVFHTSDGEVAYTVTRQPDKYLADPGRLADPDVPDADAIADPDAQVTAEAYAEGHTVVVNNYELTREA